MNIARYSRVAAFVLAATLATAAWAQSARGSRIYNPATEATIQGTVSEVKSVTGQRGWNGLHLTVQHDGQSSDVHLGPAHWVAAQGFSFAEGDQVEIVGSKVKYQGSDAYIAREVTKDGKVLILRNEQGIPKWSGGRWNRQ